MVMTGSDVIGQSTPWTAIAAREVVFDDIKVIISELDFYNVGGFLNV